MLFEVKIKAVEVSGTARFVAEVDDEHAADALLEKLADVLEDYAPEQFVVSGRDVTDDDDGADEEDDGDEDE